MNTKDINTQYDGKSTLGRIACHIQLRAELPADNRVLINNWIEKDIDELKISVMTHAFDGLDFFNSKEFTVDREAYDASIQDSLDKETL